MEPVVDKIKGFTKSTQDFFDSLLHHFHDNISRRNPIEILKRLQREAFSDLMKLRDRQDKVERILSFSKISKRSPFEEATTRLRGEVDALGAILMIGDINQCYDALWGSGNRTGISSRFLFETPVRENDTLLAEFVANHRDPGQGNDIPGGALVFDKALYVANITDWFSAIAIPIGARLRDLRTTTYSFNHRKGFTDMSSVEPPFLNHRSDSAFGIIVKTSNLTASVAQSISGLGVLQFDDGTEDMTLHTFGQIACEAFKGARFSLLGLHSMPKLRSNQRKIGCFATPFHIIQHGGAPGVSARPSELDTQEALSSFAMTFESELSNNSRIGGWIEMGDPDGKGLGWAVSVINDSEDDLGWGMSVGGTVEDPYCCRLRAVEEPCRWSRLRAESYINVNIGKKFSLKPGFAYAVDGNDRIFALMLRSSWSF